MCNTRHVFIKSILHISLKSHTQNYHPISQRKKMGVGLEGFAHQICLSYHKIG